MSAHAICQHQLEEIKAMLRTYGPEEDVNHRQVLLRIVNILDYLMSQAPLAKAPRQLEVAGMKETVR